MRTHLAIIFTCLLCGTTLAAPVQKKTNTPAKHPSGVKKFTNRETSGKTWNKRGNTVKHGLTGAGKTVRDGLGLKHIGL